MNPSSDQDLHVVFGAGGPLGNAVARQLAARGLRVRTVNRQGHANLPPNIELFRADATDPATARAACVGATVVYHTANAPYLEWTTALPAIMDGIIDAAGHADARLVYADNLYAYGPVDGPFVESLPATATGPKGRVRAQVAERLLSAHRQGIVRATIARGSDFFGPEVLVSSIGERVFGRAVQGRKAEMLGSLDQPHTFTFVEDFARALIRLGESDESGGEVWHVPSADPITSRQFLAILFTELNRPSRVQVTPSWLLKIIGRFNPLVYEVCETLYQWERPFVSDSSKYEEKFGCEVTPLPTAIRATLDWYQNEHVSRSAR